MAIGTDVKAPYYILGADGNYHKLLNENIVEQIEGVGRRPATAYEAGDVVASSTNNKVLLLCTTAGTTAETDLNIASKNAGDVIMDGTATWEVIDRRITFNNLPNKPTTLAGYGITDAGLPVGHEFFTTNPNIPAGCIPLLGGEYSRTAYADLWAWVQTQNGYLLEESAWQAKAAANGGNVPFYSKGNGTTTFRVPALKCWVKGANSISMVGSYLAAGLPNIEGQLGLYGVEKPYCTTSGAFSTNNGALKYGADHTPADGLIADFNASLSNPIYGLSDTVQPPSIVGLWCVKAYGTVTNVGSTDISNIASSLTNIETRLSVLNTLVGAENNGGIVAALLAPNGYAKYANGLTIQWGHKDYQSWESTTFDYPISMTTVYTALVSRHSAYDDKTENGCIIMSTDTNSLTFMGYGGTAHFIVIGKVGA